MIRRTPKILHRSCFARFRVVSRGFARFRVHKSGMLGGFASFVVVSPSFAQLRIQKTVRRAFFFHFFISHGRRSIQGVAPTPKTKIRKLKNSGYFKSTPPAIGNPPTPAKTRPLRRGVHFGVQNRDAIQQRHAAMKRTTDHTRNPGEGTLRFVLSVATKKV